MTTSTSQMPSYLARGQGYPKIFPCHVHDSGTIMDWPDSISAPPSQKSIREDLLLVRAGQPAHEMSGCLLPFFFVPLSPSLLARVRAKILAVGRMCQLWTQAIPAVASLAVAGLVLTGLCIRARSRHGIQIAVDVIVLAQCNMLASNTAAIVDAYDVSRSVDRSAAFSGLLIGIFMAANLTGAAFSTVLQCFRPHLWSSHARRAMFWPLLLCSCGPLLYCLPTGLIYVGRGQEWQEGLAALLLLSRILSGLGAGAASQVGLVCIAKGSHATEKSKHMVRFLFANMLGCGLGPLLAAFYHTVCPCHGEFGPQFWQLGVMKVIFTLGSALAVALCFPERLQPPESPGPGPAAQAAQSPEAASGNGSDLESESSKSSSPTSQHQAELARLARQRKVVVGCLAMTGLRGYLITALEGATALFLQKLWKIEESNFI